MSDVARAPGTQDSLEVSEFELIVLEAVDRNWMSMEDVDRLHGLVRQSPDVDAIELAVEHGMLSRSQVEALDEDLTGLAPSSPPTFGVKERPFGRAGISTRRTHPFHAGVKGLDEVGDTLPQGDVEGPRDDSWIPQRLGDFQLIERLGYGGFGTVFLAKQLGVNRHVAVKVLAPSAAIKRNVVARFMQEARALGALDHPNVVRVIDVGHDDGLHFYAMELLRGYELRDMIEESPPHDQAARLIAAVARGLAEIHRLGMIHRDIKPENILLVREEHELRPVLVDFGLVIEPESVRLTQEGMLVGTPTYMSPEQFRVDDADPRSDIYALGVTLYELLCGSPPHMASQVGRLMYEKLDIPAPRLERRGVDRDLAAIAHKALEIRPGDRYQQAIDMALDLERYLAGKPVVARPVPALVRFWRLCRRRPLGATAAVAVLVSLAVMLILQTTSARDRVAKEQAEERRIKAEQRTKQIASQARERQLASVVRHVARALEELDPLLDPAGARLDPTGAERRVTEALSKIATLGPLQLIEDGRGKQLVAARDRLAFGREAARVLAGQREQYDAALAALEPIGDRSLVGARAALLRALIRIERLGLERVIWRGALPRSQEALLALERSIARVADAQVRATISEPTTAAMADLGLAEHRHSEARLERARLLLFLGRPADARPVLFATDVGDWRSRLPVRYYRAIQLMFLALHRSGGEQLRRFDEQFDELHRDLIDPNVETTVVQAGPALYTGCRLLLERYLDGSARSRPAMLRRLTHADTLLREQLIASPGLRADRRFPSLRWTYGVTRLIVSGDRESARIELLKARKRGHVPRRDARYATLPQLAWILKDEVLMKGAR